MPDKQLPCYIDDSFYRNSAPSFYHPVQQWIVAGSRSGVDVPGYRKLIRTGQNAGSPYSVDRVIELDRTPLSFVHSEGYFGSNPLTLLQTDVYSFNGYPAYLYNQGASNFAHLAAISTSAEAEALNRLYSSIRKDAYDLNGLLFVGELREAIHMLRHPLDSASKAVSSYMETLKFTRNRAGRLRQRKSETRENSIKRKLDVVRKSISGSWLELQFGLKPLISDAKEIVEATHHALSAPARKSRVRAKSPAVEIADKTHLYYHPQQCLIANRRTSKRTHSSVMYVAGLSHTLDGPGNLIASMRERLGFNIQNFVPTIYELIPYSFLIDYFVNLGDIVSASCTDTSAVRWISKTERQDTYIDIFEDVAPFDGQPWTNGSYHPLSVTGTCSGYRKYRHVTVNRTIPSSLPLPPVVVSMPGIDSTKWLNMGALLASSRDFRFRR